MHRMLSRICRALSGFIAARTVDITMWQAKCATPSKWHCFLTLEVAMGEGEFTRGRSADVAVARLEGKGREFETFILERDTDRFRASPPLDWNAFAVRT